MTRTHELMLEANPEPRRSGVIEPARGGWVARVRLSGGNYLYLGCGGHQKSSYWLGPGDDQAGKWGWGGWYVDGWEAFRDRYINTLVVGDDEFDEAAGLLLAFAALATPPAEALE